MQPPDVDMRTDWLSGGLAPVGSEPHQPTDISAQGVMAVPDGVELPIESPLHVADQLGHLVCWKKWEVVGWWSWVIRERGQSSKRRGAAGRRVLRRGWRVVVCDGSGVSLLTAAQRS